MGEKEDLRSKAFFVCKDARGSGEICNLALALAFTRMKTDEKEDLRSKGLFVCRDARGGAEICNLALALAFTRMKSNDYLYFCNLELNILQSENEQ